MNSKVLLGTLFTVATGCSDSPPSPLRFTTTMHVIEATEVTGHIVSARVFGIITDPEALVPTTSRHDCDYYAAPLDGGVTFGDLTLAGLAHPVVVSPDSYINGEFYEQNIDAEQLAEGTKITASLDKAGDRDPTPISVDALAPHALASVNLPATVSLSAPPTVTWDSGTADEVWIGLEVSGLGTANSLNCRTSDTGSFTWPADVLAQVTIEDDAVVTLTRANVGKNPSQPLDFEFDLSIESQAFRGVTLTP